MLSGDRKEKVLPTAYHAKILDKQLLTFILENYHEVEIKIQIRQILEHLKNLSQIDYNCVEFNNNEQNA